MKRGPTTPGEVRVLIVDDDPDIVDELSSYLRTKGFLCDTASDGLKAIRNIKKTPEIGVVVTDIRMPRLDGLEMMRRLARCKVRDLAVIVVTGHAASQEAIEARELGAFDFFTKPLSLKQLLRSVGRAAESVRSRRRGRAEAEPRGPS